MASEPKKGKTSGRYRRIRSGKQEENGLFEVKKKNHATIKEEILKVTEKGRERRLGTMWAPKNVVVKPIHKS